MILTTATLDQEARFLKVVEGLDLDKLIKPLGEVIRGALAGEDGKNFIDVVADNGAAIWQAARTVFKHGRHPFGLGVWPCWLKFGTVDERAVDQLKRKHKEVGADGEFL